MHKNADEINGYASSGDANFAQKWGRQAAQKRRPFFEII